MEALEILNADSVSWSSRYTATFADKYKNQYFVRFTPGDKAVNIVFSINSRKPTSPTNLGNQFEVIPLMMLAIKQFLDREQPERFIFNPATNKLGVLYQRIAKKLLNTVNYLQEGEFRFVRRDLAQNTIDPGEELKWRKEKLKWSLLHKVPDAPNDKKGHPSF